MRAKQLFLAALIHLALFTGGVSALTLTLDESRRLAQAALLQGKPQVALDIAQALVQANPKDSHALLLIAAANRYLKNPGPGRKAAALAYRFADNSAQKHQAAQLAAGHALAEDRPTLTQIWLRRAAVHVQSPEDEKRLAEAYARVRAINPWSFHAGLSLRPSSNINNGADSAYQIIDGHPVVGTLSPDAQALSGVVGTLDLTAGYRLQANERSRTRLQFRSQIRRVALSSSARRSAPTVSSRDYGYTYLDASVDHVFAIGDRPGDHARLAFTIGGNWDRQGHVYSLARLDAERVWKPSEDRRFSLAAALTGYDRDGDLDDSISFSLRGGLSQRLENGDKLGVTLAFSQSDSDARNRRSQSANMRISYSFAKDWGPAKATAGLTLSHADFPDYTVGLFTVPGGRQDNGAFADLSLFFPDLDYAGFAPKVTLRAGRKSSNVSRFDTRDLSLSVGIQSKF